MVCVSNKPYLNVILTYKSQGWWWWNGVQSLFGFLFGGVSFRPLLEKEKSNKVKKVRFWIWWEQLHLFNNGILSLFYYIYCSQELMGPFSIMILWKKSLPESFFTAKITKFAEEPTTCSLLLLIFGVFHFLGHLVLCLLGKIQE